MQQRTFPEWFKLLSSFILAVCLLAACGGGEPALSTAAGADATAIGIKAQAVTTRADSLPASRLWSLVEPAAALNTTSDEAVTASTASQLLAPSLGLFYGVRRAQEDWPALVHRYSFDSSVSDWVRNVEAARVNTWMTRNFERSNRIGGWPQAYVNPANGIPMTWTPDSPEPGDDPAGTDDLHSVKRAWVALGRSYNIAQMQAAARIYRLTAQERYAEWAAGQLDFYAEQYGRWPLRTRDGGARMYLNGLDEAVASFRLLDTARLLQQYVGPTRYERWRVGLFAPMAMNLRGTITPLSNIQLWHMSAIAAIAMRFDDRALLDFAINSTTKNQEGIRAIMNRCLTVDNFWNEGTFAYNAYVLDGISQLLTSASLEGQLDRFTELRDQAMRMLMVNFDYRFDDNTLPNPNDSRGAQEVVTTYVHWQLFRTLPTYWGLAKAGEWRTWESLLDPPQPVPTRPPVVPSPVTRNFTGTRQAVLRAGHWQAFVHYGQTTANHFQNELTTFELHDGMATITRDPGTVDYASAYHLDYFQRGAANNVPLVDGDGQTLWAPGEVKAFDPGQSLLTVAQQRYQVDAAVTRSYRVTSQGFVEHSNIAVPSGAQRRLGVVFNTNCAIRLTSGTTPSAGVPPPLPNVKAMRNYWTNIEMAQGTSRWQAELDCAGRKYQMTVNGPARQRIYTAKVPDTPLPATRNAIYYEIDGISAKASFETEFQAMN